VSKAILDSVKPKAHLGRVSDGDSGEKQGREGGRALQSARAGGARGDGAAQADAFRERIVQASIELIREQGLSALSMREVARRAGVSHQAPYYYFADREAIIGAIAEQGFGMMREYVQRAVPEQMGAPQDAIVTAGRAYLEFAFAHPAHFRVMFRPELVSHERHPNVQDQGLRACDVFFRIVNEAVAAGLPAEPNVDALFLFCWSVVHGLACLVLDGPLDVVMPNVDRQAQLRDVLTTFSRMAEASVTQAKLAAAGSHERAAAKAAKKGKSARPTPRAKKASDAKR
jgi:AcrR family transcriptional regulator